MVPSSLSSVVMLICAAVSLPRNDHNHLLISCVCPAVFRYRRRLASFSHGPAGESITLLTHSLSGADGDARRWQARADRKEDAWFGKPLQAQLAIYSGVYV